ncbi:phage baseplate upper protein [Tetragenococcus halophilus]
MPIRKKGDIDIRTSANGAKVKQTGYTFYSYDKKSAALYFQFRGQDGQPTDLGKATIHLVMILNDDGGKEFIPKSDEIEVISAIRGTAKYVLPEMLLSYSGKVTGYVYMDFDDGSQSDDGQFTFRIKHSMITHVLPEAGDKYVQDFEDVKERVEQAGDKARNDMQKNVKAIRDDYEVWTKEQQKKQTDFENDTNKTISGINESLDNAQKTATDVIDKVNSTKNEAVDTINKESKKINEKFENLDAYSKKEVDEKLSETERLYQSNYYEFHERNTMPFNNTFSILDDRYLRFKVGISKKDFVEHTFVKNTLDDFIKWTTSSFGKKSEEKSINKENYTDDMVSDGSLTGYRDGNHDNFYATKIGTKITYEFFGEALWFSHFFDDRGGLWDFYVDDELVKSISTHIDGVPESEKTTSTTARRLIVQNLPNQNHVLIMEFKGEDSSNPPSSTAKGWVRINTGKNDNPKANLYTFETKGTYSSVEQVNAIYNSNKEFAFRIKKANASYDTEWVPQHNGLGTAFLGEEGRQKLYIDGTEISLSEKMSEQPFNEAKLLQVLEMIHPKENERLGMLYLTVTINYKGVSITGKVNWEKDTEVKSGYVNMLTLDTDFSRELISSYSKSYDLTIADSSLEDINEKYPYSFIAVNKNMPDFYLFMQSFNVEKTLRINETDRGGETSGEGLYFLQHRNEELQKLYPDVFAKHTSKKGEIYHFEGLYGFGKHPEISTMFN